MSHICKDALSPPPLVPPLHKNQQEKPLNPAPPPMSTLAAVGRAQNISTHTTNTHKKLRRKTPAHLQGRAAGEAVKEIEPKQRQPPLHIKGGLQIQGAPSCTRRRADNLRPCTPPPADRRSNSCRTCTRWQRGPFPHRAPSRATCATKRFQGVMPSREAGCTAGRHTGTGQ